MLSTVDPYFTIDGISRAFDIYYRTTRPLNSQGEEYELVTPGVGIRFGVPFSEFDTVFFGVGYERTEIRGANALPNNYFLYREKFGEVSSSVPLTIGWTRDRRDSALVPERRPLRARQPRWGALGDTRYLRANLQAQQYIPLSKRFTFAVNGEVGYGRGPVGPRLSDLQELLRRRPRHGARLRPGLAGSGRRDRRLHRRQPAHQHQHRALRAGPGHRQRPHAAHLRAMSTSATCGARTRRSTASSLRASAGIGLSWVSPVGPLEAELRHADPQEARR